jgi:SAM-dependent methyltransferase
MTCIDVDEAALAVCQKKAPNARCILTKPTDRSLPLSDGEFSLLLCIEVAPVIHSAWFCAEAARVLKPGGIMVGVSWNSASFRGLASRCKNSLTGKKGGDFYVEPYSSVRSRLSAAGFAFRSELGFCWGPFSRASDSPLIPLFNSVEQVLKLSSFPQASPWVIFIAQNKKREDKDPRPAASASTPSLTAA